MDDRLVQVASDAQAAVTSSELEAARGLNESNAKTIIPAAVYSARFTGFGTALAPLDLAKQNAVTNQFLSWNGTTWVPATISNPPQMLRDVQQFTSNGTWTAPSNSLIFHVNVWCIGAGGGGGSGRKGSNLTSVRTGGGGGGAGAVVFQRIEGSLITSPQTVTVGTAGTAGAAQGTDNTDGNAGGNGGSTSFGSIVSASGGTGGPGGNQTFTVVQATQPPCVSRMHTFSFTQASLSGFGQAGGSTSSGGGDAGLVMQVKLPTGGGAGGSLDTANTASAGGIGGPLYSNVAYAEYISGGTAGGVGANGGASPTVASLSDPSSTNNYWNLAHQCGTGGGGGGAGASGAAGGIGGAAGIGAGGGGGGAVDTAASSGAGGVGGGGFCRVTTYYLA